MANKVIDPAPIIKNLADRCLVAKGLECSILGELIDALRAAPAVDAKQEQRWIPVSERLPKYNTFVIVFAEGIVGEAVLDDADYWYWAGTDEYASEINVTHWMPLPEPPKEG